MSVPATMNKASCNSRTWQKEFCKIRNLFKNLPIKRFLPIQMNVFDLVFRKSLRQTVPDTEGTERSEGQWLGRPYGEDFLKVTREH